MSHDEERDARAKLAVDFAQFLSHFEGKDVVAQLYDKHVAAVKYLAMQASKEHYVVSDLKTPTGDINHAILRTSDTMFLTMPYTTE